jgi:flagellar motor switch protein FliN
MIDSATHEDLRFGLNTALDDVSDTDRADDTGSTLSSNSPLAAFEPLSAAPRSTSVNRIEILMDMPVSLSVELGRTQLAVRDLMNFELGAVIELNGFAGEPMEVLINSCLIAQGEVVVVNEKLGIRLTDIISPSERLAKLNR